MPLQLAWRGAGIWGTALALLVTFALSGLWHGLSWCFLVWGLLHGLYLAIGTLRNKGRRRDPKAQPSTLRTLVGVLVTFHLVTFSWIFFRASSLTNAGQVLRSIPHVSHGLDRLLTVGGPRAALITLLACLFYAVAVSARGKALWQQVQQSLALRWAAYFLLCGAILVLGQPASGYIYLQF